jgi:hypothetical protein
MAAAYSTYRESRDVHVYKIWARIHQQKGLYRKTSSRCEDNIKTSLLYIGCENVDRVKLA